MAQHDQTINNNPGATFLIDINAALAAIFSSSSGPIEPQVKIAGQLWFDTSSNTLQLRNPANSGWLPFTLGFDPTTTYTKAEADARFAQVATTYTKAQADAALAQISNSYTKAEVDAKFVPPFLDASFAPAAAPTKKAHFDFSLVTAGQDRAIRVPDKPSLGIGGWELIADEDIVPAVNSKVFNNLAPFHALWLLLDIYPVSGAATYPAIQFSADNGATFITAANYYYTWLYNYSASPTGISGATGSASFIYAAAGLVPNGPATVGAMNSFKMWGFNKPRWTCGLVKLGYAHPTSGVANMDACMGLRQTDALNAFKLYLQDAGALFSGHVTLHGLRG